MTDPTAARPVRVLHVITRMIIGGAQENTMLSCALIDRDRFPSEILCGAETGDEGSLHEECRERGVPLHLEPSLVRRIDNGLDLRALIRLTRFLRRRRFDVVHTHTVKAGILGRIAARLAGVPVIVHTAHGWAFTRADPWAVHWVGIGLEQALARISQALVVVAANDRELGLAKGIGHPDRYHVIRSGIELERYMNVVVDRTAARERLGLPATAFVVGAVGRLVRGKAPLDMFAAFRSVAAARPDAHLVFVGDGPLRPDLEAAARAAGLGDRVHVLGMRRDVPELLRVFDVLALASLWEGLPRVFPQAMAAGLPIVATHVAGAPEAIVPGENGWLVEPGDHAAMARHLTDLARDPAAARAMGARGLARVDEFSARRMVDQLAELYARLVMERRAG
ncbi:MAG: glycosyltransferase family 4 protein [Candidatus Eisenbacteria bacterium]|nr:glycosyltransferase family 4 protein [Candidatus Eisenbacteria bacterium]